MVDEAEKEQFRRRAEREGKSLSAWLRDVAREKLSQEAPLKLETLEELRAYFAGCDDRETLQEPDWPDHRRLIERSIRSGSGDA